MKTLGSRIAHYRKLAGMSQADLAKACGWGSQSRVANYEKDVREPSLMDISQLAKALRIDAGQLFWAEGWKRDLIDSVPTGPASQAVAAPDDEFLTIPLFDIQASMGPGIIVPDHLDVIQKLVVSKEWVRDQRFNHSGVPNLSIITGFGDSMDPTFRSGDPLLVDRGVSSMDSDGVYVFTIGDMIHIKRLQQVGVGKVRVISDNRTLYDPWDANLSEVIVHARVLIGLNVKKME